MDTFANIEEGNVEAELMINIERRVRHGQMVMEFKESNKREGNLVTCTFDSINGGNNNLRRTMVREIDHVMLAMQKGVVAATVGEGCQ